MTVYLTPGADTGSGARLRPDEWKSGDRLWLVDLVVPTANADNKLAERCLADLLQGPMQGNNYGGTITVTVYLTPK